MRKVPKNFHGVKGKSGRKSRLEEVHKVEAINTLWEKLNKKIQKNKELTKFEETLIAPLLSKTIQQKTDITSKGEKVIPILGGQSNVHNNNSDEETS